MPANLPIADPGDNGSKRHTNRILPPEREMFIVLVITLILLFIVTGPLYRLLGKSSYIFAEGLILLPAMVYLFMNNFRWKLVLRLNGISPRLALMSLLIGLAYTVISDELDRLMYLIYPMPDEIYESIAETMKIENFFDFVVVGLGVVVVAGLVEEALFRGFLQRTMEYHRGVTRAVTTSSLIFAAIHLNPWWIIQIIFLGMLLGLMSWRANSIIPGVIVHAVNNGLGLYSANVGFDDISYYNWSGHVSPFFLAAAVWLVYWSFKRFFELTRHLHPADIDAIEEEVSEETEEGP